MFGPKFVTPFCERPAAILGDFETQHGVSSGLPNAFNMPCRLGSTHRLLASRLLVLVITMKTFKHILVATDFGEPSERAIQVATELATTFNASLTMVHVFEYPRALYTEAALYSGALVEPVLEEVESKLSEMVGSICRQVHEASAKIRQGIPYVEILKAAKECQADLIVMGTHGRTGLARAFLGSVAEKVVRLSPVPVLTLRQSEARTAVVEKVGSETKGAMATQEMRNRAAIATE